MLVVLLVVVVLDGWVVVVSYSYSTVTVAMAMAIPLVRHFAAPKTLTSTDAGRRDRPRQVAVEGRAMLVAHPDKEDAMSTPTVPDSPSPSAVSITPGDAADRSTRSIRVLSILVIVAGAIFIVAGVVTWFVVGDQLADEKIVVSDDAERFGGWEVDGPFTAYAEADAIEGHALEASGGKTYAELDREDPTRETVMTASFLRSSLFTSVVAFGVAVMAAGLGLVLIGIGVALLLAARRLNTALAVGAPMSVATST